MFANYATVNDFVDTQQSYEYTTNSATFARWSTRRQHKLSKQIERNHYMSNDKQHLTKIIVNGQPIEWNEKEISYQQVVNLAFPGSVQNHTVTYTFAKKEEQIVSTSAPVKVKPDMEFDVDETVNS